MNEKIWRNIFKKYISDFRAIDKLQADHIINDMETTNFKNKLLADIVVTMESEVEE